MAESSKQTKTPKSSSKRIQSATTDSAIVREILPKKGYLHYEDSLSFVLRKPKLLPLKSFTMEKLEQIQMESIEKSKLAMESGNID